MEQEDARVNMDCQLHFSEATTDQVCTYIKTWVAEARAPANATEPLSRKTAAPLFRKSQCKPFLSWHSVNLPQLHQKRHFFHPNDDKPL